MELNKINTKTEEGKLLIAALSVITTECRRDVTPFKVLDELEVLKNKIYSEKAEMPHVIENES
jgi:hypothetical protein